MSDFLCLVDKQLDIIGFLALSEYIKKVLPQLILELIKRYFSDSIFKSLVPNSFQPFDNRKGAGPDVFLGDEVPLLINELKMGLLVVNLYCEDDGDNSPVSNKPECFEIGQL